MTTILELNDVTEAHRHMVGGKAFALSLMLKNGLRVPRAVCIGIDLYHQYVETSGLLSTILMELHRKTFEEMRWEEIWDMSLRIRNVFLKVPMPMNLRNILAPIIDSTFSGRPVSVRSSAPGEDSLERSFAGLHESYVNVKGTTSILEHVRMVWASLWSDRALLYRQELNLDVNNSAMAVVIQEMIAGDRSGIVFGKNPIDGTQTVIEAVYGLNQGLVDGTIEPDRWILFRRTGEKISHHTPLREKAMMPLYRGIRSENLSPELITKAPLNDIELHEVYELSMSAESIFGPPQDVEWTFRDRQLFALQARPITSGIEDKDDLRPWYLSLHRSFENLKDLRLKIEKQLLPAMDREAMEWSEMNLSEYSDEDLADEIERRNDHYDKWQNIYRNDCIPFAHGMRLFGRIYNDVIHPDDPFEFVAILQRTGMKSMERNQILEDLAFQIRNDPDIKSHLQRNRLQDCPDKFKNSFSELLTRFGDIAWGDSQFNRDSLNLTKLLIELSEKTEDLETSSIESRPETLRKEFLSQFASEDKGYAEEIIELARASYRLRDDDNIYLGKIEGQKLLAVEEGKKRIKKRYQHNTDAVSKEDIVRFLRGSDLVLTTTEPEEEPESGKFQIKARQIVGQAAGPGVAVGRARVIHGPQDLFSFKKGEILVCDAVDPGMTFVVPLAGGIVERRGGMLIHGAIIAREYGLPCVTGVPGAAEWIKTGDKITVDGFLGIVIISTDP